MRVLLVLNSLGAGGTERSTAVVLPRLRELGIDPVVVCLTHRDEGDEAAVRADGFDVRVLTATTLPGRVRELRRLLRELRPAVVHTAIFDADLVGRLAAAGTGIPVLSSLVNTPYVAERFDDPRVTAWKLRVLQAVDALTLAACTAHVHAVTEGVARDARRTLGVARRRVTVVERGRDLGAFAVECRRPRADVRAELGIPTDAPVVLAIGRVEYQKGFTDLVAAIRELGAARPDVQVLIAGRAGNASADLEASIRRAGLERRVHLLGHRDDVADLLAAADVYVLSSRYEGTAGAALEALAAGTPIVATDLAGTADILVDGVTARVVPVADPTAMAAAIAAVLDRPDEAARRAMAGRDLVRARFDLDRSARAMAALYGRVAAGPSRPPAVPGLRLQRPPIGVPMPALPGYLPGDEVEQEDPDLALSVVLCVRNGAATLPETLDALAAQQWDRPWELILVDNDSDDETPALLAAMAERHPRTTVVRAVAQHNLSYARNVGVAAARGRSVVFVDADDLPAPGFIAALGDALDTYELVVPRLEYEALNGPLEPGWSAYQARGVEQMFGLPVASGVSGWRRRRWLELGGNDEALDFSGEDTDLSLRAGSVAGLVPHFVEDAVYHYRRRPDPVATYRQAYRFGRAQVVLYERWGKAAGARPERLRVVAATWATIVRDALRPGRRDARWWWRAGLRRGRLVESARRGVWYP